MDNFVWSEDCQQAFEDLKEFLTSSSLLSQPKMEDTLYLYLTTAQKAISLVLIQLDELKTQKPIYYTSRILHDARIMYSKIEKIVFILITSP